MSDETLSSAERSRYLRILGLPAGPRGLAHLRAVVAAHLTRIPFENISKLLQKRGRRRGLPGLETWLDDIEQHGLGGTCYANNPNLCRLLRACGYDADLCGAAMSAPDVHVVVRVRLDGRELLADVGYAAPFFEPLPCDLAEDHVVAWGQDRWVLHPRHERDRSVLDHFRDGRRVHGYRVDPTPRNLDHFAEVISASYHDDATFMNSILVVRFWPGRMVRFHNLTVVEATPEKAVVHHLEDRQEIPRMAEDLLGISATLTERAIRGLEQLSDIYG